MILNANLTFSDCERMIRRCFIKKKKLLIIQGLMLL